MTAKRPRIGVAVLAMIGTAGAPRIRRQHPALGHTLGVDHFSLVVLLTQCASLHQPANHMDSIGTPNWAAHRNCSRDADS